MKRLDETTSNQLTLSLPPAQLVAQAGAPQPPSAELSLLLLAAFFGPPLKSVAYQPLPFNWKPAAEISFCRFGVAQDGQSVSSGSDSFCSFSSSWPQLVQRYS